MTREGRQYRAYADFNTEANNYFSLFASLFQSAIGFEGVSENARREGVTDDFLASLLFDYGALFYYKPYDTYMTGTGNGVPNLYGVYPEYRLIGKNGVEIAAERNEVEIYRANPEEFPYERFFLLRAAQLADIDNAIKQNLDAVKQMSIIYSSSPQLSRQLREADNARRKGESIKIISKAQNDFGELSVLKTGGDYLVTDMLIDRRRIYEDTLHLCGVRTPQEKAERLISAEIGAQNEETDSYIGTLITTVNEDGKAQGGILRAYHKRQDAPIAGENDTPQKTYKTVLEDVEEET